ncbi:glycosyltransferase family 2 protein [bacterium]|nr:MAG: glycosyltransferase family 2 protein [bacterium]
MKTDPLVSVIIPTYNRAHLIGRAIKSVLAQTYTNLEAIVVDNASSDNTAEVVNSISDGRLKFIRHDVNKGPAASRNTGLRNSRGDYITFLDSDDEWFPQKTALQLDVFKSEEGKGVGLVFANGFNEAGNAMFITGAVPSGVYYDPRRDKFYPLKKLIVPPSGWMLPAGVAKKIGYFDESMITWDDGDYLVRIAYEFSLYFLNKDLVIWHAPAEHLNVMNHDLINGKEIFLRKNYDFLKRDKEYLFRFYRSLGKDMLLFDKKKARAYLYKALKIDPVDPSTIGKIIRSFAGGRHA